MAYGSMTMEERLKEHIKEYSLENLLDLSLVKACFEDISKVLGIELLLTQRHRGNRSGGRQFCRL